MVTKSVRALLCTMCGVRTRSSFFFCTHALSPLLHWPNFDLHAHVLHVQIEVEEAAEEKPEEKAI